MTVEKWERVKSAERMCEEGLGRLNIVIANMEITPASTAQQKRVFLPCIVINAGPCLELSPLCTASCESARSWQVLSSWL